MGDGTDPETLSTDSMNDYSKSEVSIFEDSDGLIEFNINK